MARQPALQVKSVQQILEAATKNRRRLVRASKNQKAYWALRYRQAAYKERINVTKTKAELNRRAGHVWKDAWTQGAAATNIQAHLDPGEYGTLLPEMATRGRVHHEESWKWRYPFRIGDRVAIAKGRFKGRIDTIQRIDYTRLDVTMVHINQMDFPHETDESEDQSTYATRPVPFHMDDIRLVTLVPGKEPGSKRPVVVDRVMLLAEKDVQYFTPQLKGTPNYKEPFYPRFYSVPDHLKYRRYIAGTSIEIPWPEEDDPLHQEFESDTRRIEIEESTYVPTLQLPPLPTGVIDELRNKYLNTRVRHEPEWIAAQEHKYETAKKALDPEFHHMRTPLEELKRQRKRERAVMIAKDEEAKERLMRGEISMVEYFANKHNVPVESLAKTNLRASRAHPSSA